MKRIFRNIVAAVLAVAVIFSFVPEQACAADPGERHVPVWCEYIGCEDLGNGFVAYNYVSSLDGLSVIQPYNAAQITKPKYSDIYYIGEYVLTVCQTATFVYGVPNGIVTISSKSAYAYAVNSNSQYKTGGITSVSANGSPAVVISSFNLYMRSDGSYVNTLDVRMYCHNSGVVS